MTNRDRDGGRLRGDSLRSASLLQSHFMSLVEHLRVLSRHRIKVQMRILSMVPMGREVVGVGRSRVLETVHRIMVATLIIPTIPVTTTTTTRPQHRQWAPAAIIRRATAMEQGTQRTTRPQAVTGIVVGRVLRIFPRRSCRPSVGAR